MTEGVREVCDVHTHTLLVIHGNQHQTKLKLNGGRRGRIYAGRRRITKNRRGVSCT